ncbi:MAG: 2-C-methyl-D-erythritol 4-phosphate cytidylyltransferase [Bacteroidota bacterium]|nr:2-C-methyl-D-erythritol 4-phosphate cytidylyltransferase [Bacteroidota bacterium]
MQKYAIIVAGGKGKRVGTEIPKQFIELRGKPVLIHTIEKFYRFDKSISIIIVLPESQFNYWTAIRKKHSFKIPHEIVKGGPHRFYSVKNGLELVRDESLVAVHDGVRPLVSTETIRRCFEAAEKSGNAIPVVNPAESLRMISEKGSSPVSRDTIRIIQTPQVFRSAILKKAYLQKYDPSFSDDATVLERSGETINLVEGNRENIKITNPEDLLIVSALLDVVS